MTTPTRRGGLVFPERLDSPEQQKESNSMLPEQSQFSSPRVSLSNSFIGGEVEADNTNVFSDLLPDAVKWKKAPKRVINSWTYSLVNLLFVVFTLFGESVKLLATPKEADDVFSAFFLASLVFFSTDCFILFTLRHEYRWSVSFWFDVFATLTLITDITWIWSPTITETLSDTGKKAIKVSGNASRVASRTLRLIKLIRLVRVLRVMKPSKNARDLMCLKSDSTLKERMELLSKKKSFEKKMRIMQSGKRSKANGGRLSTRHSKATVFPEETKEHGEGLKRQPTFKRLYREKKPDSFHEDHGFLDIPVESRVSKLISERTTKQFFFIVLIAAFLMPYFLTETFANGKTSYEYGLELMEEVRGSDDFVAMCQAYVRKHERPGNLATLISLRYQDLLIWHSPTSYDSLRIEERQIYVSPTMEATFDMRTESHILAAIDLFMMGFLCGMLLLSGLLVAHDFSTTVLFGVERMITLIKKIARNPMLMVGAGVKAGDEREITTCCLCFHHDKSEYGAYEMQLLEQALHKIGSLLALGLGTAGCEIITRNIRAAGRLDPLIPGKKVLAVFCFIAIRGFDVLTDVLGSKLLIYVNKISKVVHGSVEKYQGGINRNLGEGYFAVWKFEEDDGVEKGTMTNVNMYSISVRLKVALALISSIKTLSKVARSSDLADFLSHSGMHAVAPFLSEQLSIGLHVGWAFEGPVGSAFKIDATYLSPHVNKTARLESATRMYDVPLLASDDFVDRLDEEIKPFFRHIDTVILKGTADPIRLHTFDLALQGLGVSLHEVTKADVVEQKEKVREAFEFNYFNVHELFTQSEKIAKMRVGFDAAFMRAHKQAMQHYIEGRWLDAKDLFHRCLRLMPMDGPSLNILAYMERYRFQHPEDWCGVRTLGAK